MHKQIAKVLIVDEAGEYLVLWRSNHPVFPNDPDLPGGTIEAGETPVEGAVREVLEEADIALSPESLELMYKGSEYSEHDTIYYLFTAHINARPEVTISWEHYSYHWLSKEDFLKAAAAAKDTYMHMVSKELK